MSNSIDSNAHLYAIDGFAELRGDFIAGLAARVHAIESSTDLATQAQVIHRFLGAARCYGEYRLAQILEEFTLVLESEKKLLNKNSIDRLNVVVNCLVWNCLMDGVGYANYQ